MEKIGSSAEIYEFGESDIDSSLRIKAKVRQRFKVIESRQQVDGYFNLKYIKELQVRSDDSTTLAIAGILWALWKFCQKMC